MSIVILGIDLGKNSCSIVGIDANGTAVVRRRIRRDGVIAFAAKLAPCVMAMEACCGAHHVGRSLAALGLGVRLMSPEYVQPYVKAQKNDDRDAGAIAEAASRPTMRFVELKSEEQLDIQTLHRVRDRLVGERTSLTNQIRSLLLERGHIVAQGYARLRILLGELLDCGADAMSPRMVFLLGDMRERWAELDRCIAAFDAEFAAMARTDDRARRLNQHSRHRCAERHRTGGRGRLRRDLQQGARSCRVGGARTPPSHHRRRTEAPGDHEAWKPISSQNADPGRPIRHAIARQKRHGGRRLAPRASCPRPSQYRRRRPGREDGPHSSATDVLISRRLCRHEKRASGEYFVGSADLRVVKGRWPDSRSVFRKPPA
jgi:transposase